MTSSSAPSPVTDWKIDQLGDLDGKRYLITGANAGIGYEAAAHLRRANADVIVAARSTTKGADAVKGLTSVDGAGTVELVQLDLASIDSIRKASETIHAMTDGLDAVINNAGIMQPQIGRAHV